MVICSTNLGGILRLFIEFSLFFVDMPAFITTYLGELRCDNLHEQSGTSIFTDAPADNQGKGSSFSPTDLCALSLTTCIITTMGIYANLKGFPIEGMSGKTTKVMQAQPRKIAKIISEIRVKVNDSVTERQREGLARIMRTCPVSKSLHPDIEQDVTLVWE